MQFNRHEYALLSRRGNVPAAQRAPRRPVPESEPWRRPPSESRASSAPGRLSTSMSRAGAAASSGADSVRAFYASVRATWTAFGTGGRGGFGGR